MRISTVEAIPVSLPFARELALSTGPRSAAEHLLVAVTTDDGVTGYGECVPRPTLYGETMATAAVMIEQVLAPRVLGVAVSSPSSIVQQLSSIAANPSARAAVELAAFDAFARHVGAPAVDLLGGHSRSVPLSALLGYGEPSSVADEAESLRAQWGVSTFKFKIGPTVDDDVEVARALRDRLGEEAVLYADVNQLYSVADALRFLRGTQDCALRYVEEPTTSVHHEEVSRRADLTLLGDESCVDASAVREALEARRCQAVSIKIARTGLRESGRIRDLAVAFGATAVIGSQGDAAVGALTAASFGAADASTAEQPAEVLFFTGLAEHLVTELPDIRDGRLHVPDSPGFGFDIDLEKLRHHRLDRSP